MKLAALKHKHSNEDIYVVGSGPTLNYIATSFFVNKIVICVNHTINHIPSARALYLIAKEPTKSMQQSAANKNALIVMCKHHSGVAKNPLNEKFHPDRTVIFAAKPNVAHRKDQMEALERSSSTIISGIHLAAYMDAKNIILVGHDCGTIDKEAHVSGYSKEKAVMQGDGAYKKWMKKNKVEIKTLKIKEILKEHYDINLYSLNPFINFGLEGHKYERF